MAQRQRRVLLVSIVATVAVFAVLFVLVGLNRIVDSLLTADPSLVAFVFVCALAWLLAWSLMLRTVLGTFDVTVPRWKAFFVYTGAVFANNVTPFAQAGGEPVAALLISKASETRYETGLATITSVDVLNVVPSVSLIVVGVGYYATTTTIGERLETAVLSAVLLVGVVATLLWLAWQHREAVATRVPELVVPRILWVLPTRFQSETLVDDATERIYGFFENVERLATNRRTLAFAVGLSLVGWLFQAVALTLAFAALGHDVSPAVAVFAVPLANLAGATPLPGGLGGIEAAFVALLVPTTGVAAPTVTAAVLIFRGAVYWLPVVVGGLSVSTYSVRILR
jgi:uncharacterized protein (TIRG00374 family)